MIELHTFKALINTVVEIEAGICKLEEALNCHFDDNWMTSTPCRIINAIANGFFDKNDTEWQVDTIEELLYHFIYMEDCGNNSEHCKSKMVVMNEGKANEMPLSCTNLDELYSVIRTYIDKTDTDFTFSYCHSYKDEVGNKK